MAVTNYATAAGYKVYVGLKESGGLSVVPYIVSPFQITRGQHCKIAIIVSDSSGKAVNTQPYTVKIKIPTSGSVLVKTTTPINYAGGEAEVSLSPAETLSLALGANQNMEVEASLVSTPTTTQFYPLLAAFTTVDPLFPGV